MPRQTSFRTIPTSYTRLLNSSLSTLMPQCYEGAPSTVSNSEGGGLLEADEAEAMFQQEDKTEAAYLDVFKQQQEGSSDAAPHVTTLNQLDLNPVLVLSQCTRVYCMRFFPETQKVWLGFDHGEVIVYSVEDMELQRVFRASSTRVIDIAYHMDCYWTFTENAEVALWHASTFVRLGMLSVSKYVVRCATISDFELWLHYPTKGMVQVWSLETLYRDCQSSFKVLGQLSKCKHMYFFCNRQGNKVRMQYKFKKREREETALISAAMYHKDTHNMWIAAPRTLFVVEARTKRLMNHLPCDINRVTCMEAVSDGTIWVGGEEGKLVRFNPRSGACTPLQRVHKNRLTAIAPHADHVLTTSLDGILLVWDAAPAEPVYERTLPADKKASIWRSMLSVSADLVWACQINNIMDVWHVYSISTVTPRLRSGAMVHDAPAVRPPVSHVFVLGKQALILQRLFDNYENVFLLIARHPPLWDTWLAHVQAQRAPAVTAPMVQFMREFITTRRPLSHYGYTLLRFLFDRAMPRDEFSHHNSTVVFSLVFGCTQQVSLLPDNARMLTLDVWSDIYQEYFGAGGPLHGAATMELSGSVYHLLEQQYRAYFLDLHKASVVVGFLESKPFKIACKSLNNDDPSFGK